MDKQKTDNQTKGLSESGSEVEIKVNNADRDHLIHLLENPSPGNEEMKNLMLSLDEN